MPGVALRRCLVTQHTWRSDCARHDGVMAGDDEMTRAVRPSAAFRPEPDVEGDKELVTCAPNPSAQAASSLLHLCVVGAAAADHAWDASAGGSDRGRDRGTDRPIVERGRATYRGLQPGPLQLRAEPGQAG